MGNCEEGSISAIINHLRMRPFVDFAALAVPHTEGRRYEWRYVSGNANQRHKRMFVKAGKGLPGAAMLYGRLAVKYRQTADEAGLVIDCPMMLAEGLQSAAAIPISTASKTAGVLMVGCRLPCVYSADDIEYLKQCAGELAVILKVNAVGPWEKANFERR
jgi:nitrogen regulatory protein A